MNDVLSTPEWYAVGDPWSLTQAEWNPGKNRYFETVFTQSNGYVGSRGYTEERNPGLDGCREDYLAGVFGEVDEAAMKLLSVTYPWPMLAMITLPEIFSCEITLGGERFGLDHGSIDLFNRTLYLYDGLLTRHVIWTSPEGRRTRLAFERFWSSADTGLAMQRIAFTPENWSGKISVDFAMDGDRPTIFRCGDRALPHLPMDMLLDVRADITSPEVATLAFSVQGTGHGVALASGVQAGEQGQVIPRAEASSLGQSATWSVRVGETVSVERAIGVSSTRDGVPEAALPGQVRERSAQALQTGFDGVLAASRQVWKARWAVSDIALDGPPRDQAYLRFSMFSLLQMGPFHTDKQSIPARAYAYNRYHGLYYWDSETFLMPPYLHTHPEVAKNLLSFRHSTLDGARRTARNLGASGACFPWMTDSEQGNEQGPWGIGDYLWHQNADIAYAVDQYVHATGDLDFMAQKGLEIMVESARFWMSRIEEDSEGVVHLHKTVGPDELDKHGRDNGYTSLMARHHFRLAARWLERVKKECPEEVQAMCDRIKLQDSEAVAWLHAADRLAVPNVPGHHFPLQDEFLLAKKPLSFEGLTADEAFKMRHTHRVVKQADIITAMFLLQNEFSVEQMRDAYDFYEPMCLHYSSLSYNTHSIIATKIGRHEQAYDYFLKAAGLDLDDLREASKDGLHAAALGGTWQTLVFGFLGMEIHEGAVVFRPELPKAWKAVSLSIVYRGYRLDLKCEGSHTQIKVTQESSCVPADLELNGQRVALSDGLLIENDGMCSL